MLYGIVDVLFFFFFLFRHDFVRPISLEPLLAETPNWVCCLVLRSSCALLLTIQFASLFFYFFIYFFFCQDFIRTISLEPLLAETPNWVCCLVLRSSCALLLTIQFASLFFFFFSFFLFFCHDFVRVISLEPLLAETPNWVCCLVLWSNFALLLTIQFALLFFFFFFFSATILSGPYLWNRYVQRLQIECAAWSCSLILHCCLPSNSLCFFLFFFSRHYYYFFFSAEIFFFFHRDLFFVFVFYLFIYFVFLFAEIFFADFFFFFFCTPIFFFVFFFRRDFFFFFLPWFCLGHISGTVTRRDSKLSVLLGPAV